MVNKQCFMPFFYDWYEPFSSLSGSDCKKLILAMVNYCQNGGEIPEFTGRTKLAANFIFPQLDRAREATEVQIERGRKGGLAKQEHILAKQVCKVATNTNTNTNTNANTNQKCQYKMQMQIQINKNKYQ